MTVNFEKIEQAFDLLLTNVQQLQSDLATNIYDAIVEQNAYFVQGEGKLAKLDANNEALRALNLTAEEWRRAYQYLLMKANQLEPLQRNHQLTPDTVGFLLLYVMEVLCAKDQLDLVEIGSGTGNLAETLVINSAKKLDYLGIEVDDLLIDLAASTADVIGTDLHFIQEDAVRPQLLKPSDVLLADLPVGFYPDDVIASRYQVASKTEHTYAHHLLMEQGLKYLKPGGLAIFLAPRDLLTSPQSDLLKAWLQKEAQVLAMVTLPENLFHSEKDEKTLYVLAKRQEQVENVFVYPLTDLNDATVIRQFMEALAAWRAKNLS
ncbi:class I SAM-dependent methyltransferase [Streptococcus sp. DD12]|uniref:class I SAM-dependent methyltransferase n=1 Tax=Streptococcus sp. DD12 TaxID=1777880 RepID=UPI00079146A1|nr:class I SAM-dependent methyltransferase [Streptococcus sp. DD12]KXT75468.1 Adenine-specific methyltransferase [Streptococcus sp. DD12]